MAAVRAVGDLRDVVGCSRGPVALSASRLPLRVIVPLGLTAAICRTFVTVLAHRGLGVPRPLLGVLWCVEAGLLTGLLDITGGPFNPFIVMYAAYIWSEVALSGRPSGDRASLFANG
jgi:hypothetical protein